ncbi:RWD domain-containing protein 1-like [Mustela putorius furo]|uniref:RWD domain-containing protein 1-like n=1 Tax=Mustela putorius furo TaxID=9669 RepID=A0A8U0RZA1_MUSPF|nr:RWD domain-containing protein 1-like [Mustela putorius furo]
MRSSRKKNELSGKQPLETHHDHDTLDMQCLEDAGNNAEVDEFLFPEFLFCSSVLQETDDLELEDEEDDSNHSPADPESDLTN